MVIRFDEIEATVFPNFKGGDKEFIANMFFDGTNRIFKARLIPGASIGLHTHEDSCEVIFILEGNGTIIEKETMTDEGVSRSVQTGDCLYCPKGHTHSLMNTSDADLLFYAVVPQQ